MIWYAKPYLLECQKRICRMFQMTILTRLKNSLIFAALVSSPRNLFSNWIHQARWFTNESIILHFMEDLRTPNDVMMLRKVFSSLLATTRLRLPEFEVWWCCLFCCMFLMTLYSLQSKKMTRKKGLKMFLVFWVKTVHNRIPVLTEFWIENEERS
jgi:hypothetical protein